MTREEQVELMKECLFDADSTLNACVKNPDGNMLIQTATAFFQYRADLVDLKIGRIRDRSVIVDAEQESYIRVLEYRLKQLGRLPRQESWAERPRMPKPKTKEDGENVIHILVDTVSIETFKDTHCIRGIFSAHEKAWAYSRKFKPEQYNRMEICKMVLDGESDEQALFI